MSKSDTAGTTTYLVDTNQRCTQVLQEYVSGDSPPPGGSLTTYLYGDDLISQTTTGTVSYYHYDGNMSIRQLTDFTGTATDTYTYDAFGNLIASSGSTINYYLYTGEQYDPNAGFYYLRARLYDPAVGRFITPDNHIGSPWERAAIN